VPLGCTLESTVSQLAFFCLYCVVGLDNPFIYIHI